MGKVTNTPLELGRHLGEEFICWLWMRGLNEGGTSGLEEDGTALFLDQSVHLAAATGDVQEVALKKGNPAESVEAFQALHKGMRPIKATFRLLDADREWTFGLVAATLDLQSAKLPRVKTKDPVGNAMERLLLLEELNERIRERFEIFIRERLEDPESMESEFRAWIESMASVAETAAE